MTNSGAIDPAFEAATYRKVTGRLLPILILCYLVAYLDRVNIGFARLQMMDDLGFSETVYGFGAGIFFIGYFLFEVPSNIILHRVGARVWIGRIMITWGMVSGAFMFVKTPLMFYSLRFLLGLAEAGFYPGIILYLTYWFPSGRRARMTSLFMTAIPISGIFGGPVSGWIMQTFAGTHGWDGWQWLFLIEAVPSVVLGVVVIFYLDNGIRSAKWLTEPEKVLLERRVAEDGATVNAHLSIGAMLSDSRIWLMCLIYFSCAVGQYGLTFWMPVLIQTAGVKGVLMIGMLTAVPYAAGAVSMLVLGHSADRRRTRRAHLAFALILGAVALSASAMAGTQTVLAIGCLTLAAAGILAAAPLFWSLPTAILRGTAAAAGIATINSVANLGGFISPTVVGGLRDMTGSTEAGMFAVSATLIMGAIVALSISGKLVDR
ncbi:MAG: MFS transporter [Acidobacteriota bacterium]